MVPKDSCLIRFLVVFLRIVSRKLLGIAGLVV
jgi:hypothetical protein